MRRGETLGPYRILDQLGVGGMGVVYRAEDLRLGREVALKVLAADLADDPAALERFQREAKLASALNHPHICTVHDIAEHDGRPFIVMELLEGQPLREVIRDRPLPNDELVDLAIQIADALEAAHRRGIVHRDLKPSNVFVLDGRYVKVLDFGVAKLVQDRPPGGRVLTSSSPTASAVEQVSETDSGAGTTAYMSPEQARGETVDARTDLFSFGSVLYQMATGRRAFPGTALAVIFDGILNRTPIAPRSLNPALPAEVEQVIEKALEKDLELRYQDAADVLADLRRVKRRLEGAGSGSDAAVPAAAVRAWGANPSASRSRAWWRRRGVLLTGVLVIASLVALLAWWRGRVPPTLNERDSVLLGGFTNTTGDPVFDGTLREALAVQLSQSPFLDIVPNERVSETLQMMTRAPDERLTHALAREVCERQGVKAMLEGSIASLGRVYVLTLDATDCREGETIAREQIQVESKERVLQGLGRIASTMRTRLGESLTTVEKFGVPIEQATTSSLEALKAYAIGVARRASGTDIEAIPFFRRAVQLDPQFASAYSALSSIYGSLGEADQREANAKLAYEHREHVTERERLFIEYQYHDAVTGDELRAIEILEVWKQSYPRDYRAPNALAVSLNRFGQYDRAIEEGREAVRRNPSHPFPYSNLAYAYRGANLFADARQTAEKAVSLGIATLPTHRLLFQLALLAGTPEDAQRHVEWARTRSREFDLTGAQAQAAAFEGRMATARELYRETTEAAAARGFPQVALGYAAQAAWTEALYGNHKKAIELARGVLAATPTAAPRFRAAAVLALAGAADEAERELTTPRPSADLFVQGVYVPVARATVQLSRRQAAQAIETLRAATPYELGNVAVLAPVFLRGRAHALLRQSAEAVQQFEYLRSHRGVDPFSPLYPLAQLELGRAAASRGDHAKARAAYDAFLAAWAGADANLPVLVAARAERDRLGGGDPSPAGQP